MSLHTATPSAQALIQQAAVIEQQARYADGPAWSHDWQRAARLREQARQLNAAPRREEASRLAALAQRVAAAKAARAQEQAHMEAVAAELREQVLARRRARDPFQTPEAA